MTALRPSMHGLTIGVLPAGPRDSITDVPGVRVGHATVLDEARGLRTGVTIIEPCRDPWAERPVAACDVLNGFGKSVGLVQVEELGEIETAIGLTNTLAVWAVAQRIAQRYLELAPGALSANPVVGECNDGLLSDIRAFAIGPEHVDAAFEALSDRVDEGNVGAGAGMRGFGYKAGVGTASRVVSISGKPLTVGVLVLTNTGSREDLRIDGFPVGRWLSGGAARPLVGRPHSCPLSRREGGTDDGSIMMVCSTNAPVDARQLRRIVRRCALGLARVGATAGHGSGDITVGFAPRSRELVEDRHLSSLFRAAVEATEAAIVHSLFAAEACSQRDGKAVPAIPHKEVVERILCARRALLDQTT